MDVNETANRKGWCCLFFWVDVCACGCFILRPFSFRFLNRLNRSRDSPWVRRLILIQSHPPQSSGATTFTTLPRANQLCCALYKHIKLSWIPAKESIKSHWASFSDRLTTSTPLSLSFLFST
ncbi:hypothetical protein CPC08DRAFT_39594 [Agrocybe pediades]|nr:hypothetical protein CPC08DRAFT_39594 [Agrocybe pediades]